MSSTSLGPRRPPSWMAAVHDDGQMAACTERLRLFPDSCHVLKAQPCISWTSDKWKSRKDYPRITNHGLTFSDSESIHTYHTLIKWSSKPFPNISIRVETRVDISNNYSTSIREYQNLIGHPLSTAWFWTLAWPPSIHEPSFSPWKIPITRCSEYFFLKKGKSTFWATCELVGKSQPLFKEFLSNLAPIFSKKSCTSAAFPLAALCSPQERMHAPIPSDMTRDATFT